VKAPRHAGAKGQRPVFCLRPEPDCSDDVQTLAKCGVQAFALPMLQIEPFAGVLADLLEKAPLMPTQMIITSKQAARLLAANSRAAAPYHELPLWCVGAGSAAILRAAGFKNVKISGPAADALAAGVISADNRQAEYLWLSGRDIYFDLEAVLGAAGYAVRRAVIYEACAHNPSSAQIAAALGNAGGCGLMALSARTVTLFDRWLAEKSLASARGALTMIVLSEQLAEAALAAGFNSVVAANPTRRAILETAQDWALSGL